MASRDRGSDLSRLRSIYCHNDPRTSNEDGSSIVAAPQPDNVGVQIVTSNEDDSSIVAVPQTDSTEAQSITSGEGASSTTVPEDDNAELQSVTSDGSPSNPTTPEEDNTEAQSITSGEGASSTTIPEDDNAELQSVTSDGSPSTLTTPEEDNTEAQNAADPEHLTRNSTKTFLEQPLLALRRVMSIPVVAAEAIIGSVYFGPCLMLAMLFATILAVVLPGWLVVHRLSSFVGGLWSAAGVTMHYVSNAVSFTVGHVTTVGGFLYQTLVVPLNSTITGNTTSAPVHHVSFRDIITDTFCALSPPACLLASWLLTPQATPGTRDGPPFFQTVDNTSIELHHWASISIELAPFINEFQLASIPLAKQAKLIEHNEVSFNSKDLALQESKAYSQGLVNSGRCLYGITLITDRLIKVTAYNLREARDALTRAAEADFGWWKPSIKKTAVVGEAMHHLLGIIDEEIGKIIIRIDLCEQVLNKTSLDGADFDAHIFKGLRDVEKQIKKKQGRFGKPDPIMSEMSQILSTAKQFPTLRVIDVLAVASLRLQRHREEVQAAQATVFLANRFSDTGGLNQLISIMEVTFAGLSNLSDRLLIAREDQKKQFQQQTRKLLTIDPPA